MGDVVGYVYFLQDNETGAIKIGYSTDIPTRMASLRSAGPGDRRLIGVVQGPAALERELHKRFAKLRIHPKREWFRPGAGLLGYMDEYAVEYEWSQPVVDVPVDSTSDEMVPDMDVATRNAVPDMGTNAPMDRFMELVVRARVERILREAGAAPWTT